MLVPIGPVEHHFASLRHEELACFGSGKTVHASDAKVHFPLVLSQATN
jgi:hypothetical protein